MAENNIKARKNISSVTDKRFSARNAGAAAASSQAYDRLPVHEREGRAASDVKVKADSSRKNATSGNTHVHTEANPGPTARNGSQETRGRNSASRVLVLIAAVLAGALFFVLTMGLDDGNAGRSTISAQAKKRGQDSNKNVFEQLDAAILTEVAPIPRIIYVTPEPTSRPAAESTQYVQATANVYVRLGPSCSSDILGVLKPNNIAVYKGQMRRDERGIAWFLIEYGVNAGWVSSRYSCLI